MFQHTAARRRLHFGAPDGGAVAQRSFNTQPPEGGCRIARAEPKNHPSFNTQPPEGGCGYACRLLSNARVSTHSRPKAAAPTISRLSKLLKFQHTAARRRLRGILTAPGHIDRVSTHSRPKAAASISDTGRHLCYAFQHTAARRRLHNVYLALLPSLQCFNTQPPEGGCGGAIFHARHGGSFNTQPPEGGCMGSPSPAHRYTVSTHSRPKAAARKF